MRIRQRDRDPVKELPDERLRHWIAGDNQLSGFRRAAQGKNERRQKRELWMFWGICAAVAAGIMIWLYSAQ
jgi:hypothetical protein